MDIVQLCEIRMLVAFGCLWPFNIMKSWRSKTAKGKSVAFEIIVVCGYDFASASCGSNELQHAATVLIFNPARFGYVSSFAGHTQQRAQAALRGVDMELISRIQGRKDSIEERFQYDEWAAERFEAFRKADAELALINYTRNQYVLLNDDKHIQGSCAALF